MKKNITYILGAGASHDTLPLMNELGDSINNLKTKISHRCNVFKQKEQITKEEAKIFSVIIEDLDELYVICQSSHTIDTHAKKLSVQGAEDALNKLKTILSVYFTIAQAYKPVKTKYNAFLSTILSREIEGIKINDNIKILSWNYDYQLELALNDFTGYNQADELDEFINIYPRKNMNKLKTGFAVFKLNGSACSFVNDGHFERNILQSGFKPVRDEKTITHSSITEENEINLFKKTIEYYQAYLNGAKPAMHFAWENDPIPQKVRALAKQAVKNTQILVVIGYSFPTFNREIDRDILSAMTNLEKVYIQIPQDGIDEVVQKFNDLNPIKKPKTGYYDLTPNERTNKNDFFIPSEF